MKLEFHPETVGDLNDAVSFYDEQLEGLGSEHQLKCSPLCFVVNTFNLTAHSI